MKIDKFELRIEPCWDERKTMKVTVFCNGQKYQWTEIWPEDDFNDRFYFFMRKAEHIFRAKMEEIKNKIQEEGEK